MRDRIAWWLSNLVLNTIATRDYRRRLRGIIDYGLASGMRDEREGRPIPGSVKEEWSKLVAAGVAKPGWLDERTMP